MNRRPNSPKWENSDANGHAEALEQAFCRLETLLGQGIERHEAMAQASADLDSSDLAAFEIGARLQQIPLVGPTGEFASRLERQLTDAAKGATPLRRSHSRRPARRALVSTAAAACLVLILGISVGAARSLPGESLYNVKRGAESARLGISSERNAARYHIVLADRRLGEADRLLERSKAQALAASGPGRFAAEAAVSDPRISALIQSTIQEARANLQEASQVLIRTRDTVGLARIVKVAHRGQRIVASANDVLGRERTQLVLVETEASLKLIERVAQQAHDQIVTQDETVVIKPCATPTPTPLVTPSPSPATGATPTPSPTPVVSPTPTPTSTPTPSPTPTPTPCLSPPPTATPEVTATPAATARPTVRPSPPATPRPQPSASPTPARTQPTPTPDPSGEPSTSKDAPDAARSCGWVDRLLQRC